MATGRKTGGRRKGTPNKVTAEIRAAFQLHGDELVAALVALTKSDDERVRLGAIQACLDRGWGRAVQGIEISGGLTVDTVKDQAPEWLSERLAGGQVEVIEDQVDEPDAEPVLLELAARAPRRIKPK